MKVVREVGSCIIRAERSRVRISNMVLRVRAGAKVARLRAPVRAQRHVQAPKLDQKVAHTRSPCTHGDSMVMKRDARETANRDTATVVASSIQQ